MNLLDIKQYLMRVKIASLASLVAYFKTDADVLQQMLSHWVRKGCVRQCKKNPQCGVKCAQCPSQQTEIYEWVVG